MYYAERGKFSSSVFNSLFHYNCPLPFMHPTERTHRPTGVTGADSDNSDFNRQIRRQILPKYLSSGTDDTQLNFAWRNEKGDDTAFSSPFGTDKDNLETFRSAA